MKLTFFLVLTLIYSLFVQQCAPKPALEKAIEQGAVLSALARDVVREADAAYTEGGLTREQKNQLADAMLVLGEKGGQVNAYAAKLYASQKSGTKPTKPEIDKLLVMFTQDVVDPLVSALAKLKLINKTPRLQLAIDSLKASILIVAAALNKRPETERKFAEVA